MAVLLKQFVKQLEESGILAGETLRDFLPPKSDPKNAEELLRELLEHKKLTKFQAEQVWQGKGKSLVLDNYLLLEKIGAGGMGIVFKARHRRIDRIVAIKVLPANVMKTPAIVARFEREVQAVARISHPNIVAAFDAGQADGVHFLVMEYVAGNDLAATVKKNGPLPVDQAVNYILQTARGLESAHQHGIVHRDIKPANLLLDQAGTVKILDMGLARLSADGEAGQQAELTNTGTIMGTVDYMAPEQALDTKGADTRADIYSLGCSLFYLLTGRATYGGDTLMAKLLAHRDQVIPSILAIRPEVPEQVEAVFRKMVAKSADDRYQSAAELIADLEQVTKGQPPAIRAQPSFGSSSDDGLTNFLQDISLANATPALQQKSADREFGNRRKRNQLIGGGVAGVLILLAGIATSLKTNDGISVVAAGKKSAAAKTRPQENERDPTTTTERSEPWQQPAFEKWRKEVAALPAEKQVSAVAKKLRELNPGFDGKVAHKIDIWADRVTEFAFTTDKVSKIAPVRALNGLKHLYCGGTEGGAKPGILSDLSPLQGLQLATLHVPYSEVADLSPLRGMPLTALHCYGTHVSDLSSLRGMRLTHLRCDRTQVSDLSPIQDMPLIYLMCYQTQVTDLSPLRGMALIELHAGNNAVDNLSPLTGMPLRILSILGTKVTDLSPLIGMPLKELWGDFQLERDTETLRSLESLEKINGKPAAEFWKEVEQQQKGKKP